MSIVQKIEFKIEHPYFAGFLQHALDENGVHGSVSQEEGEITLILSQEDPEALERFSNYSQKYLPHSIFLGKIQTQIEDRSPESKRFHSTAFPLAPCALCIEEITDPASDHYLDDTVSCRHYGNDSGFVDEDSTFFSPHYAGSDTVLLTDASKVHELFLLTDAEIQSLFSIEKPTLKVTIKDEELKQITGKKFIRLKAPYNVKSVLAALNAKESEISTLFFSERPNEPQLVQIQEHRFMIYDNRISAPLQALHEDQTLNRFLNLLSESGYNEAIGASLSRRNGINFVVHNAHASKKAISLAPFEWERSISSMMSDEKRRRLLENFASKFPEISIALSESEGADLFKTIALILDLDHPSYETLEEKAMEFHGNGGLKIDMNFHEEGFDYAAMLGSIMSFRIAGVESHYLAYSIFEAYGDMVVSVLGQLKREFKIDRFILLGDLMANSVLFSRILSKFQLSQPYISARIALDSRE